MHATCTHTHPFFGNRYYIAGSRYFCSFSAFSYIFSFSLVFVLFCFPVKKLESLQNCLNYYCFVFVCCINGKTYQVYSPQLLLGMQAPCFSAKSKPKVIRGSLKSKTMPIIFTDVNIHI